MLFTAFISIKNTAFISIKNTAFISIKNNTVKYYYNIKKLLIIYSVSHDPSEIILISWFGAQKTFLIVSLIW